MFATRWEPWREMNRLSRELDRVSTRGGTGVGRALGVGDFHRTFMIGESINTEAISAKLIDGVLTLRLPKAEDAKPRRIEVKAN